MTDGAANVRAAAVRLTGGTEVSADIEVPAQGPQPAPAGILAGSTHGTTFEETRA